MIARCSVDYEGRLSARLPIATRLVMVKADGCVAIHADGGAYKPLNWMIAPNVLVEATADDGVTTWSVTNAKGERLVIRFEEVLSDTAHELGSDPGLEKDGVEAELQELLAARPDAIAEDLVLVRREYPTDIGPVDLLCRDRRGRDRGRGGQAPRRDRRRRAADALRRAARARPALRPVRGMFVAQVDHAAGARARRATAGFDASRSTTTCCAGCGPSDLKLF